jgi:hypothetical protein
MFQDKSCVCVPLLSNWNKHSSDTAVIGLYFRFTDGTDTYINFTHPDELDSDIQLTHIKLSSTSLVFNKKAMLYHGFNEGIDLNSYLHYYAGDNLNPREFYPKGMEVLSTKFFRIDDLGHVIPLANQLEWAKKIAEYVLRFEQFRSESIITQQCIDYCNDFTNVFYEIEKNEILVGDERKKQNYMWYTATSRPSNAWNNFNFSALNKKDGTRNKIHSRFEGGKIVQFDYDAFHIKLLAKILDYKFDYHPYEQIKAELGMDGEYDAFKTRVFQNIYGRITSDFIQHPFFQRVQVVIDQLWEGYEKDGYVDSHFYGKLFRGIQDPTPNKVFNYILQSLETEYNVKKIKNVLPVINDKKSIFSMYLYDAFVFDIHPDEENLINLLKNIFETDGMTVKVYAGDDFGAIKRI